MWRINRPTRQAGPTFIICISRIRDQNLKVRLESIEPFIIQAENEYIRAAESATLNSIHPSNNINGSVTNNEMKFLYDYRMAKSNSPGRIIYDELISAPAHGRCPLCGHRDVSTLDHLLSKSIYSELTVTPVNLVPSCKDCNKTKSASILNRPEDVILHPYFDNIEDDRWLYAEVLESSPASLRFYIQAPNNWDVITSRRVNKHFKDLKLDALYRSQAAEEIINIRHQLDRILQKDGMNAVRDHLQDAATSRAAARVNSWQRASYEAFANSDWFCNGGFM